MRSFALCSLAVGIIASPAWADFLAVDYLPLAPGNFWAYLVDGSDAGTTTVLPEMEKVNGRSTFVLAETGGEFSGSTENVTNDSNGLRLHKLVIPPGDGLPQLTAVLKPPLKVLKATIDAGIPLDSSGQAKLTLAGVGTFGLNYTSSSTAIGLERVTVPFGTFDALRVDSTLTIFGKVDGRNFLQTGSGTDWYGFGVGLVKTTALGSVTELVTTNVPEPSALLLRIAAIASLGALARRRKSGVS